MSTALQSPQKNTAQIDLVDDHDEVFEKWAPLNLQNETLVHLDEHSDFRWISDKDPRSILKSSDLNQVAKALSNRKGWKIETEINQDTHLGNFLYRVFEKKMVKTWYWVFPTPLWNMPKEQKRVFKELQSLYDFRKEEMTPPKKVGNTFQTTIMGVNAIVCSLEELPCFNEPILLSLDVDFLTSRTEIVVLSPELERTRLPWIWPDDLLGKLAQKNIKVKHAAIANSIHEGYTPIRFKYFGESLKASLQSGHFPDSYDRLKKAFLFRHQHQDLQALNTLDSFTSQESFETTRLYEQAQILYDLGKPNDAKKTFQTCRDLDPDYSGSYNDNSFYFERTGNLQYARREHKRMRYLAPDLLQPLLGEALYLAKFQGSWQAIQKFEEILKKDPQNFSALFSVANLYFSKIKDIPKALEYYLQALNLEPDQASPHICIGTCYLEMKDYSAAKKYFREALRLGMHNHYTYRLLAQTYLGLRKYRKSWEFFTESLRLWVRYHWQRFKH